MKKRALLGVAAAAVAGLLGTSSAAHAAGVYGPFIFYIDDPSFSATDPNGTFTAQVKFGVYNGSNNPMAVSFKLSPYLQGISTGNKNCTGYQYANGVQQQPGYGKGNMPPDYLWHFTVPNNPYGVNEEIKGNCVFPVEVDGNPGEATVTIDFKYFLSDGGGGIAYQAATGQPALTDSVSIRQ
jgi:hypothetical protein